jgi:hypothetical protein
LSHIAHFAAYAAAFEKAFESDDWSVVEPFFTEDAVYETQLEPPLGGRFEGRPVVLAYMKDVLDAFDRRFESREIAALEGPTEEGDRVRIRGTATYRAAGVPTLVLELEETAHFEGERIRLLEDRYEPEAQEGLRAWFREHAAKLGIAWKG